MSPIVIYLMGVVELLKPALCVGGLLVIGIGVVLLCLSLTEDEFRENRRKIVKTIIVGSAVSLVGILVPSKDTIRQMSTVRNTDGNKQLYHLYPLDGPESGTTFGAIMGRDTTNHEKMTNDNGTGRPNMIPK